jgi:arsenate reductase
MPAILTRPHRRGEVSAWRSGSAHPRLIQWPIITADDGTAVVGRDPESLAKVLRGNE